MGKEEKIRIKEMFEQLKNGNEHIITELYNKCSKTVYGIAFSIVKNNEDAEDIVQVVFEKLVKLDKEKLPVDKETTWLYTVTKNEALSFFRNKNNNINLEEVYNVQNEDKEIDELLDREVYNKLISKLDGREKEIVSLKILSNLSFSEIGQLLGEPTGTIKWRYYKAVYTLKMTLSNFAMFLITFMISILTFKNGTKDLALEDSIIKDETEIQENKEDNASGSLKEDQEISIDNILSNLESSTSVDTISSDNINYIGYGFLGLSTIFLVITIICAIFLGKRRLKSKKKTS